MTGNNTSTARNLIRTLLSPLIPIFLAGCVFLFCFRFFAIDPFDVHESLFRRLAEEMKELGGLSTQLTFNAQEFSSTSPIYPALLAMMSWFFDGEEAVLSSFSGRFLGVFFSFLSVLIVHRTFKRLMNVSTVSPWHAGQGQRFSGISPVYFFLMSFMFLILGLSFGPASLVMLCVAIFICTEALRIFVRESNQSFSLFYTVTSAFALSLLSALTSVWVLVMAGMVSVLYCIVRRSTLFRRSRYSDGTQLQLGTMLRDLLPQFMIASLFSWFAKDALFARSAFDPSIQSGGILAASVFSESLIGLIYTILAACGLSFVIGWIVLFSLVGQKMSDVDEEQKRGSADKLYWTRVWLLVWVLGCSLFCILPVAGDRLAAPALVLPALCLLASVGGRVDSVVPWARLKKALLALMYCLSFSLAMSLLALAVLILFLSDGSARLPFLSEPQKAILDALLKHWEQLTLGLFLSGSCLLAAVLLSRYWIIQSLKRGRWPYFFSLGCARLLALIHMVACVFFVLLVAPVLEQVLTGSVQQSALKAKMFLGVGDKLAISGFMSPTVVSTLREPVHLWTGSTESLLRGAGASVILVPEWDTATCRKLGFDYAQAVDFFRICLRSYQRTLEGREK